MARYFFDIVDFDGIKLDQLGLDCETPDDAARMAIEALPEVTIDRPTSTQIVAIQIRDADGQYIFRASLTLCALSP